MDCQAAVVLIHSALVCRLYCDLVILHPLSPYHLLNPDISGPEKPQVIGPFPVDRLARLIADLIHINAINGSAHIISHCLGAQIAIRLGSTDLDVVNSVFIPNFEIFSGKLVIPYAPYAAWAMTGVENIYSNLVSLSLIR
ncbi:Alpha/beta hydrolase fold-1 [Penicillium sp. IBT 35674x]|nr:Alpha/beta hydrolase fold-1 [Penicillium sp. IBT 35674x]